MKHLYTLIFLLASCFASAQAPAGYYSNATGTGFILKTQLKTIIDATNDGNGQPFHNTSVTYNQLWQLYETSDVRPDGKVWDMYSNCNFTFVQDQDTGSGGGTECDKFNREHTFPRSWFDNNSLPIFADAFNVVPTDKKVNAERGNLAYGEVASANFTSLNGSKRGSSSLAGPTGQVFEPTDEFKGDIARGFFYLATRYQDEIAAWETNDTDGDNMLDGSSNKVFEQWALDMLFSWHINDPVSQKEIDRNNAVFNHQNNRNPFIDNPQYVFDIWQNVLSVEQFETAETIKLYPNPTTTNEVTILSNHDVLAEVFDILGKKVKVQNITAHQQQLNLSGLSQGIYLMRLKTDNGTVTKKLIKQ